MGTITESAMAALGGISIVHYNTTPSAEASFLRSVKSHCVPLMSSLIVFSPTPEPSTNSKLLGYAIRSS
ncbi:hypothetical protein LINGRAHAP2_LOCUS4464 [Linum grandiflorum]